MGLINLWCKYEERLESTFYILLFCVISIPVSILSFNYVMHIAHPTSFSPSDSRAGFTDGPNSRGTINIVWTCFSTIFTCVYVSLHLDVPFGKGEPQGWWEKLRSWMLTFRRKALWIVINIVAPELVVFVAIREFQSARSGKERMKNILKGKGTEDGTEWTLAQAFFADMGGFKVRSATPSHTDSRQDDVVVRSGDDFYKWLDVNPLAVKSIDYKQVGLDIEDKSNADSLLKTLTVLQASWLVVQMIARTGKNQPVSELEVTTCAYVLCTVITYICWWHKPYGAQKHILLHVPSSRGPTWKQNTDPTPANRSYDETDNLTAIILSGFVGAIIGAIHRTLSFANSDGQLLWRICCITQIVIPLLMSLFLVLAAVLFAHSGADWHGVGLFGSLFACFIQCCARIVLFILIGYSFQSWPTAVYTNTDWSWPWFPHVN